jgi:hypothetical protein
LRRNDILVSTMTERHFYTLNKVQTDSIRKIIPASNFPAVEMRYSFPQPQVFFMLSGGVVEKGKRLVASGYDNYQNPYGILEGKPLEVATARIAQAFPKAQIVTLSSGKIINRESDAEVNYAEVHRQALINMGVAESRISTRPESLNSMGELKVIIDEAFKRELTSFAIITPAYSRQRVETMWHLSPRLFKDAETLEKHRAILETTAVYFADCQEILSAAHSAFNGSFIEKLHSRPSYQRRIESEQKGVSDLLAGKYIPKVGVKS